MSLRVPHLQIRIWNFSNKQFQDFQLVFVWWRKTWRISKFPDLQKDIILNVHHWGSFHLFPYRFESFSNKQFQDFFIGSPWMSWNHWKMSRISSFRCKLAWMKFDCLRMISCQITGFETFSTNPVSRFSLVFIWWRKTWRISKLAALVHNCRKP